MKVVLIALVAIIALTSSLHSAFAQDSKPINLALWDPVQIFKNDVHIHGVRLNIYGVNAGLKGVDVGIVNRITGDVSGVQWGIVNLTEGAFTGWHDGWVNHVGGHMAGLQTSYVYSGNATGQGVMLGAVTNSTDFVGLQLGIVNYAITLGNGVDGEIGEALLSAVDE